MGERRRARESRRYSNLMDLQGVQGINYNNYTNSSSSSTNGSNKVNPWIDNEFNLQERRFFNDFRPFFLLCQLSGMFPNKLSWKLPFSWTYWATYLCLLNLIVMTILLIFYCSQVQKPF